MPSPEDRITELESQLAHTQRLSEELSDVVAEQAKRIDVLEARVQILMQRAAADEAASGSGIVIGDQPPPHW